MLRGAPYEKYGNSIVEALARSHKQKKVPIETVLGTDLELIEALRVQRGSITLQEICEELLAIGDFEGNISSSTVWQVIKKCLPVNCT